MYAEGERSRATVISTLRVQIGPHNLDYKTCLWCQSIHARVHRTAEGKAQRTVRSAATLSGTSRRASRNVELLLLCMPKPPFALLLTLNGRFSLLVVVGQSLWYWLSCLRFGCRKKITVRQG